MTGGWGKRGYIGRSLGLQARTAGTRGTKGAKALLPAGVA